jgi:hypothetical protein
MTPMKTPSGRRPVPRSKLDTQPLEPRRSKPRRVRR